MCRVETERKVGERVTMSTMSRLKATAGAGVAALAAATTLVTVNEFAQPDGDSPYARGTPAPVVRYTGEDAHRVDFDVAWSPNGSETWVKWSIGEVSDSPTLTGSPWRRNGTTRPGTTVSLTVRSRATLREGGWVTGRVRVDGHPVGTDCEVISYRSCTITYVIPPS